MKSSKKSKPAVDEISRETQRLVKDSHVCLPYHKPKQKSLKDFLNRQKITSEFQASLTGSKKLLQKAWELIENKEKTVEKFYNEDCAEENISNCEVQVEKIISLNDIDDGKPKSLEFSDDEKNYNYSSDEENKLSTNYDDDENSNLSKSSEDTPSKQLNDENSTNSLELNDLEDDSRDLKNNVVNQFIDDEAESSDLESSPDEDGSPDFINDSDGEEEDISTKKKRRIALISESSDDEDLNSDINFKPDDFVCITNEPANNISTQQLMDLCSGQFQTQTSEAQEDTSDQEFEDDFDSEVPLDTINSNENEDDNLCSSKDFKNDYEPDILENDNESSKDQNELESLKLTSAKDFFDDEAELSESDWSSDDEDHLVDSIDALEEEAGDKDKLDEDVVKDGLDKIYMRQLLDDDNQQVTALKEMLLEDGELHSDSGRKRKFQWDEIDEDAAFKKPLFSDNEEDLEEALSDDEKSVHWRKERFKRETFLSKKNNSDNEEENYFDQESSDNVVQPLVTVVKKTHIVKFEKSESNTTTNIISLEKSNYTVEANKKEADIISPNQLKKFVRGSFMKHNSEKMTTTLLYMNKKSSINDNGQFNENSEIKSLTTITSKAGSNPFAYLIRNDKQDINNIAPDDLINNSKKENSSQNKTSTSIQPAQKCHQNDIKKSTTSILKLLE